VALSAFIESHVTFSGMKSPFPSTCNHSQQSSSITFNDILQCYSMETYHEMNAEPLPTPTAHPLLSSSIIGPLMSHPLSRRYCARPAWSSVPSLPLYTCCFSCSAAALLAAAGPWRCMAGERADGRCCSGACSVQGGRSMHSSSSSRRLAGLHPPLSRLSHHHWTGH
jgi:hypothetical protein